MYRFALRPLWLLSHVLVLLVVIGCIAAGFWQLSRLQDKRDAIDRVETRGAEPVAAVEDLVSEDSTPVEIDAVALRPVEITGTYLLDEQVTVGNRTFDGAPGYWVMTPIESADGTAVVVNRGWVPLGIGESAEGLVAAAPPAGEVTVRGTISETQTRGSFGSTDPIDGDLDELARADIARIDQQTDVDLLPAYITLSEQTPDQGDVPTPVVPVPPGEGPHLGYAVQWFIFATIGLIGYPLVLRRVAHDKARDGGSGRRARRSAVPVDDLPVG